MVVDYRTRVLKISEEDELDTKLTRIPSARSTKVRGHAFHAQLCPSHGLPVGYLNFGRTEALLAYLLSPMTSVPGHVPFCPQTLSGSPLRDHQIGSSTEESLSKEEEEEGWTFIRLLFPHPPGEGQGLPSPSTHLLTRS